MVNDQLAEFAGADFRGFFIVTENRQFGPADARLCRQVRDNNGIANATVLYDPSGTLNAAGIGGRHFHRVLREGSVLEFGQQFRDTGYLPVLRNLLR